MPLTISQALAEIHTIEKRIEAKRELVARHVGRRESQRDPFEKKGGVVAILARALQAIRDLEERRISIRCKILAKNLETKISIDGEERSVQAWLSWKREIAEARKARVQGIWNAIQQARDGSHGKVRVIAAAAAVSTGDERSPEDIILHVDEEAIAKEREHIEKILGDLDGMLSMSNATTYLDLEAAPKED